MRATSTALVCLLAVAILAITAGPSAAGYMVPMTWDTLSPRGVEKAELIAAGKIVESKPLDGVAKWWRRSGKDLEPHEAAFAVDHVIRGPQDLTGTTIRVQFIGSTDPERPTFASVRGNGRALLCAAKQGDAWRLAVDDEGAFAPAGPKPELPADPAPTEAVRLERELVSAMTDGDRIDRIRTLRYVGFLRLSGPDIAKGVRALAQSDDRDIAPQALYALVRMGDRDALLTLDATVKAMEAKGLRVGGGPLAEAIRMVRAPEAVPALVRMTLSDDLATRGAAAFAMRFIKSPDAVAALVRLLDDADMDLRFTAVDGLWRQTGLPQQEWRCNPDQFKKDPDAWTGKWKVWWQQTGQAKYPSLDDVLRKLAPQ